ncbi:MAG: GIY-YIG nuclease family protein [Magnetospirillum sp.]|nr:GIY-YIG nuclease family protein [Magnetospirillum sp.]
MTKGRSIRLFLADGNPGGIITAEIMNWTGHVMFAPRSRLADLIRRPEAGRTGVYFLTGSDPEGAWPLVYVGETDNVGKRLAQHNKDESKEFWDRACVITSKDHNLTKAHVLYLESRLIAIATQAGRAKLVNGTAPEYGQLSEADIADMEFFIEQVRIVLPVLGLEFLREAPKVSAAPSATEAVGPETPVQSPLFEIISRKHDLNAEAREVDGDFIVLAGSLARKEWSGMEGHSYQGLYHQLVASGTLVPNGTGHLVFKQDTVFRSPSAAAAVVFGRASNGRKEWCVKGTRKTYADWQEEQVEAVSPAASEV